MDYCKEGTIAIGGGDCCSREFILRIRSDSLSRVRQKEFFFYREQKTRLERTGHEEVG